MLDAEPAALVGEDRNGDGLDVRRQAITASRHVIAASERQQAEHGKQKPGRGKVQRVKVEISRLHCSLGKATLLRRPHAKALNRGVKVEVKDSCIVSTFTLQRPHVTAHRS